MSARPTSAIESRIIFVLSADEMCLGMSGIITFWNTVMWPIRKNCWKTTPTVSFLNFCRSSFPRADVTWPATFTVPWVGKSSAEAMLRRVVLPLPEGPTTATIPPFSTWKEMASRAFTDSAFVV